jgi:glucose-6-phosphate-specific signal transduction histidine kinase
MTVQAGIRTISPFRYMIPTVAPVLLGIAVIAGAFAVTLVGLTDRVEALGGSIRVSSRPGKGTQIAVALRFELKLSPTVG